MNLLYISNLSNNIDAGLNWSVPATVKAQQEYDNVLWIDLSKDAYQPHWSEVRSYHNIKDFGGKLKLNLLPVPFNSPDCVIFEGFYYIDHVLFAYELLKNNIPYIIVPRSAFTSSAFNNGGLLKRIKKQIAHAFIFDYFVSKSCAIHYLTEEEKKESQKKYHKQSFIIPNGITLPNVYKRTFSNGINGVFIGRQDIYQKGLDLLLESIREIKSELIDAGFRLDIYGPPRYDVKKVSEIIANYEIGEIVKNHEKGVRGTDKEKTLLDADVFFLTSRFEGHPMGLIEALSYGIPALITRGANMAEEVKSYNAGWACETNKDDIKASMRQMIIDKSLFSNISNNSRNLAKNYDWKTIGKRNHDVLLSLLDKNIPK